MSSIRLILFPSLSATSGHRGPSRWTRSSQDFAECIEIALRRAGLAPEQIDIVSTHATGTMSGDAQECAALRRVFGNSRNTRFNNAKSFIGHAMGAAGALELAGNLPAFRDGVCHATINVEELDPDCELAGLVANQPQEAGPVSMKQTVEYLTPRLADVQR